MEVPAEPSMSIPGVESHVGVDGVETPTEPRLTRPHSGQFNPLSSGSLASVVDVVAASCVRRFLGRAPAC